MKYEIRIEGGFTGIPKIYQGEIDLDKTERNKILESLKNQSVPVNENLRDGILYWIHLTNDSEQYEISFDDTTMPEVIRDFINSIQNRD